MDSDIKDLRIAEEKDEKKKNKKTKGRREGKEKNRVIK